MKESRPRTRLSESIQTIDKATIFSIDYLLNGKLTDEDVSTLLKRSNFTKSIIVGMYRFEKLDVPASSIIKDISTSNSWVHSYRWTRSERSRFEKKLARIYKNVYSYGDQTAKSKAEWFTTIYGFDLKEAEKPKKYWNRNRNKTK